MRRGVLAAVALVAIGSAPAVHAAKDVAAQASCLAKQLRRHDGPEGGRASAMKGHFECFPEDPQRFVALFGAGGTLTADHEAHLELFFAARPALGERAWSAKAVGGLAAAEPRTVAASLYSELLALQLEARPAALLDTVAKLDDVALAAFWSALQAGPVGARVAAAVCAERSAHAACVRRRSLAAGSTK